MVRQRDLAGPRPGAAADQRRRGGRVVRRAKRPRARQGWRGGRPASEATAAASTASSSVSGGSSPGRRRASMLLPVPGGPISSRLWPPAAAISRARFAWGWPWMSRRSSAAAASGWRPSAAIDGAQRLGALEVARHARADGRPADRLAAQDGRPRRPDARGTTATAARRRVASNAGRMPRTGRTPPVNASSPRNSKRDSGSAGIWPDAASTPMAIGRSKRPPNFGRSAGARLTVILRSGKVEAALADRGPHALAAFLDGGLGETRRS